VLYLDRFSGRRSVPISAGVGPRLPGHATAVGKILLAYAPDDVHVCRHKTAGECSGGPFTRLFTSQGGLRCPARMPS
jgi:DNA-binding IclR family transcriptional regulator